jgi:hypothetical protein
VSHGPSASAAPDHNRAVLRLTSVAPARRLAWLLTTEDGGERHVSHVSETNASLTAPDRFADCGLRLTRRSALRLLAGSGAPLWFAARSAYGAGQLLVLAAELLFPLVRYAGSALALWLVDRVLDCLLPESDSWDSVPALKNIAAAIDVVVLLCARCRATLILRLWDSIGFQVAARTLYRAVQCGSCGFETEFRLDLFAMCLVNGRERKRVRQGIQNAEDLVARWDQKPSWSRRHGLRPGDAVFGFSPWWRMNARPVQGFVYEDPRRGRFSSLSSDQLVFTFLAWERGDHLERRDWPYLKVASPAMSPAIGYIPVYPPVVGEAPDMVGGIGGGDAYHRVGSSTGTQRSGQRPWRSLGFGNSGRALRSATRSRLSTTREGPRGSSSTHRTSRA